MLSLACHCVNLVAEYLRPLCLSPATSLVQQGGGVWSLLSVHVNMYISQARASRGYPEPIFHAMTCTIIFSKVLG